jgi:hypothetical protein
MIEPRVAFRIDILWLNQSPGETPGCFFVYRIIGKCVAIIFCYNTCGSAAVQENPCEYYETDECNAKGFYVNHLGKLYTKSTIKFKYDMKNIEYLLSRNFPGKCDDYFQLYGFAAKRIIGIKRNQDFLKRTSQIHFQIEILRT